MSFSSNPTPSLRLRDFSMLFIVALLVALVLVAIQPVPGYMDADYYYAGGKQLADGHGFSDPFLWNYLDHPQGLPHPSNSYWNPLASMVAAGGMLLSGKINFLSARIGFILMAVLAPLAVAALSFRMTQRKSLALVAGFLTIFSGYYLPFIVTTDNYSLYMLVGAIYFLGLGKMTFPKIVLLGVLAGMLNLARGDGILWLPITLMVVAVLAYRRAQAGSFWKRGLYCALHSLLALLGYLLVMGAWFIRNYVIFRALMPPGSGYVLWMTNYSQLFSFTPEIYTFHSWLASGLQEAINGRASAVWQNLSTAFFAQGMIFLVPLILVGIWKGRRMFCVQVAVIGWLGLLLAESMLFPFASVRGGFFHAGTVFQPVWFALAPFGLDELVARIPGGKNRKNQVQRLLQLALVVIMVAFSAMLVKIRVIDSGWNEGEYLYLNAESILEEQGVLPDAVVMVRNPPAYFIMTGRQAIVVPYGNEDAILAAARKFNAAYLILESVGTTNPLYDLYAHPEKHAKFGKLGALGDNIILKIEPSP